MSGQQDWITELAEYFKITPAIVLKNYCHKQKLVNQLWDQKNRNTTTKIFSFYQETDYFVYRQKWFNRHKAFWDIALPFFLKPAGRFCEYGSGIGPVTNWLIKLFPAWKYTLVDLNCPVFQFARWRFSKHKNVDFKTVVPGKLPLIQLYDIITCQQVLEHIPDPFAIIQHLVRHLKPGGWLYLNYINKPGKENLEQSARQRKLVLDYLNQKLQSVFSINPVSIAEGYGLYLKKRV